MHNPDPESAITIHPDLTALQSSLNAPRKLSSRGLSA
ncbi:hypothetical protein ABIF44_002811 [Bradyrhizobium japonicum]|jgi:hypothetical protein|nr:hypothetical protein [Bradyrhizobium japonicum]MCS3990883.1 hypothetical protein [Bradyrhizobium japonicum]MCS4014307.1 hypothetical protein [Bradyrhizobium japonicum]MCS4210312.1 hypothetical protein [Bradyrhizobium japonicum]MDH6171215.1 hypothetical protein [Bradyrhizobium japonicum]